MRTIHVFLSVLLFTLLAACGTAPTPTANLVITAPAVNAEFVTGSTITVTGTVVEGAGVSVSIGAGPAVAATLAAPTNGRQSWSANVTAPATGSHTITATATSTELGSVTATVSIKVVAVQPYGGWQGLFYIDRRPNGGDLENGGTMIVWYGSKWFRMYFGVAGIEVEGTTDGWDLIDKGGLRITGTYHAAGETNDEGHVMDEPWVEYYVVLESGDIILGTATPE